MLSAEGLPQHFVILVLRGFDVSGYTLMGFEDLWGAGGRDFNDLAPAVDFGRADLNGFIPAQQAPAAPKPLPAVGLVSGLALLFGMRRFQIMRA